MKYTIKAIPTRYADVLFRSRLEARWAAFLDLIGWRWEYEPCLDLEGWIPDFRIEIPCGHSECEGSHILLAEVKPYSAIKEFDGHPSTKYPYGRRNGTFLNFHASAQFGYHPRVTFWEMAHGAGGGEDCVASWVNGDLDKLWDEAGLRTRYRPNH